LRALQRDVREPLELDVPVVRELLAVALGVGSQVQRVDHGEPLVPGQAELLPELAELERVPVERVHLAVAQRVLAVLRQTDGQVPSLGVYLQADLLHLLGRARSADELQADDSWEHGRGGLLRLEITKSPVDLRLAWRLGLPASRPVERHERE